VASKYWNSPLAEVDCYQILHERYKMKRNVESIHLTLRSLSYIAEAWISLVSLCPHFLAFPLDVLSIYIVFTDSSVKCNIHFAPIHNSN
jgi:hypothetical protein